MKNKDALTMKTISGLSKVPEYSPASVKKLMARHDLNERAFAMLMNVTPHTVRLWTTGAAKPCGLSRRLMQIFDTCPEVIEHITTRKEPADC
ncbi:helix-turn-helix domain-containing protein [Ohessyouella blattaphilus]|uniref:XRE family transcriptional regulator n=1 Tax=Ohessyouella blattaphilus TaxID=2949333 RepID=A0ABT1EK49_9FIRM|nr:XRE family transcriptional regulator [Ohessyouella blattaphilus]MCP1109682.1 XRE family transcriptional regulator [Ohessyouella blattaphilus]MCR8563076.1 XRE family transcriptional regulator [Ohessyouella blattaphilus]